MVKPKTYGRMGNFLFQAAAAMGYAWKHGLDFTLPCTTNDKINNPIYLQHLVNTAWNEDLPTVVLKEQTHGYQELPFREEWRGHNIILDGYWQSEKYFKQFRDRILAAFEFPWTHLSGTVSVHVRRTDYLTLTKKHPPVPKSWIENAMTLFPDHDFAFFSDDIEWCKREFGNRGDVSFGFDRDCVSPDMPLEVVDLVEMSWCAHHICSASTFSWWGMYLNRNPAKRVIFPKNWFQPGYRKTDTKDIIPEWCERL